MNISVNFAALREAKWYQFALRFCFGGAICVLAGVIAEKYGPAVGGLFLAFPAIFPASATLLENEQKEKKQRAGLHGTIRGRKVAGVDAVGRRDGQPRHDCIRRDGMAALARAFVFPDLVERHAGMVRCVGDDLAPA